MERKKLYELLFALGIIALLIVGLVLYLQNRKAPIFGNPDRTIIESPLPENFDPSVVFGAPVATPEPVARTFVERYGSFSSEAGYENIDDILALATADFRAELERIASEARAEGGGEYYGISTRVISVSTLEETAEAATLEVQTQRTETIGAPTNTTTRYQKIRLNLVKVDGAWLISKFQWE